MLPPSQNPEYNNDYISMVLVEVSQVMAQTWDNEPVIFGCKSGCFQHIHCPQPTSTPSCLFRDHALSPENLSPPPWKASADWSPPIWLTNLCKVLALELRHVNRTQEENPHYPKTTSTAQADTTTKHQTGPPNRTDGEEVIAHLSLPMGLA
jgi:hypothetical protein